MIEHSVHNDAQPLLMAIRHPFFKILICAKPAIHFPVIYRVVAMGAGFKKRADIKGIAADIFNMVNPRNQGI